MGRPIEIKLDAETTAAERNLDSTADSLDDVADALDDVDKATRGADRGLDDVADAARDAERGLKDARDGADNTARVLDRDLTQALDRTADAGRDAARDIKESFKENALTAEDVFAADVKAEILSNAAESGAEVIRGFKDGVQGEDLETIVDGITDTFVSVGMVGGPVGLAAGAAAGSVVQMFAGPLIADAEAKAEEFQETFTDAFQNIATAGADMGRELAITSIAGEFAQDTQKMADATKVANALGVERGAVLRAMAGDQKALTEVTEAHNRATEEAVAVWDREAQQIQDLGLATEETAAKAEDWREKARGLGDAIGNVNSAYENNTDALNAATEAASAKAEVDAIANQRITDQAVALANSTGAAQRFEVTIDGATRTLEAMPGGKVIDVTDGGSAELTQQQINAIHGKAVTIEAVMGDIQAVVDQAFRYLRPPVVTPTIGPYRTRDV